MVAAAGGRAWRALFPDLSLRRSRRAPAGWAGPRDHVMRGALGGPRVLLRRLREVMAEPVSAQERLDKIVVLIAANMVAEVCSVYVLRVDGADLRSEEHTSELQSLTNLVCRLLLEKKKKQRQRYERG